MRALRMDSPPKSSAASGNVSKGEPTIPASSYFAVFFSVINVLTHVSPLQSEFST
jgi:hypothetical protein